jgi:hypothetical protein
MHHFDDNLEIVFHDRIAFQVQQNEIETGASPSFLLCIKNKKMMKILFFWHTFDRTPR